MNCTPKVGLGPKPGQLRTFAVAQNISCDELCVNIPKIIWGFKSFCDNHKILQKTDFEVVKGFIFSFGRQILAGQHQDDDLKSF